MWHHERVAESPPLTPLRRILTYAVRERLIPENPVGRLGRDELPASDAAERRVFTADELTRLLDAATPRGRLPLRTLAFTGLRASELLGLVWSDIDTAAGTLRVTRQLDGAGQRVKPKTPQAVRTVYLAPFLARELAAHRLAARHSGDDDFVFGDGTGGPWTYAGLVAGFKTAVKRAKLGGEPRPTLHSLRHGFGSMLIAQGSDVVFTSRQLGHASPAITMRIYAHEFGTAESAARMTAGLEGAFGAASESG